MAVKVEFNGLVKSAPIVSSATPGVNEGSGSPDQTNAELVLDFTLTLSGSYVAGGDALDFTSAPGNNYNLPSVAPSFVEFMELATIGTAGTGFKYAYAYGPTLQAPTPQGGALQIFGTGAASGQGGTEAAAGLYSGLTPSLNNKQIRCRAHFAKAA